jgi:hypothetical protein
VAVAPVFTVPSFISAYDVFWPTSTWATPVSWAPVSESSTGVGTSRAATFVPSPTAPFVL